MSEEEKPRNDLPRRVFSNDKPGKKFFYRPKQNDEMIIWLTLELQKLEPDEVLAITFRTLIRSFFTDTAPFETNVYTFRIFLAFWNATYNQGVTDQSIAHQFHFVKNEYYRLIATLFSTMDRDIHKTKDIYEKKDLYGHNETVKNPAVDLIKHLFTGINLTLKSGILLIKSLNNDIENIKNGTIYLKLLEKPLFNREFSYDGFDNPFVNLENYLLNDPSHNWLPWVEWMMARYNGHTDPFDLSPEATKRVEIAVVNMDDSFWGKGPPAVNAEFIRLIEEERLKEKGKIDEVSPKEVIEGLGRAASPAPSIDGLGRLHAGPNVEFDRPIYGDDLATLPIIQRGIIDSILMGLPPNTPKFVIACFKNYEGELAARGAQPILGVLTSQFDIIIAEVSDTEESGLWLGRGMTKAVESFKSNHKLLLDHFPLNKEREDIYRDAPINLEAMSDPALTKKIDELAHATIAAEAAGIVTEDYTKAVLGMQETAKIVVSMPPKELIANPEDRFTPISVQQRAGAQIVGFSAKSTSLLTDSASVATILQSLVPIVQSEQATTLVNKFMEVLLMLLPK